MLLKTNHILAIAALITMVIVSCKKPPPDPPVDEPAEFRTELTLDGVEVILEDGKDGYLTGSTQSGTHAGADGFWNLGAVWAHISGNNKMLQVNFQQYYYGPQEITLSDFEDIFSVGSHPAFIPDSVPGINVVYQDGNGGWWDSDAGTQDDWSFEVTASEPITGGLTGLQKVTGTFRCKVYDTEGNFREITNASFVARMTQPQ